MKNTLLSKQRIRAGTVLDRQGFFLFMVIGLLVFGAIIAFAMSSYKRGAVEQLSKTIDQNRLIVIAQAANSEVLACLKKGANNSQSDVGRVFRKIFSESTPLASGFWTTSMQFSAAQLPVSNAIANEMRGFKVAVESKVDLVICGNSNTLPTSYLGYLEIFSRAYRADSPQISLEIKERREVKLANLRDFLDKYVLYVKSYVPDYNDTKHRLVLKGIPKEKKAYSWVYLGNRFYPKCMEYPNGPENIPVGRASPPILLDIDFVEDAKLLAGFTQGKVGFSGCQFPGAVSGSSEKFFWVTPPTGIPFKPFFDQNLFKNEEFYSVQELRDYYKTIIVDTAFANQTENSVSEEIVKDYNANKNNYAAQKGFQALIKTCVDSWVYHFGYTDYSHISDQPGKITDLLKIVTFQGIFSFFNEYDKFNNKRLLGGKMPLFFGRDRKTPVMIEGNAYVRFFKIAFFDQFTTSLDLFAGKVDITMPPLPLNFVRPDKPIDFQNRLVPKLVGEKSDSLMTRPVDEFPINRFFYPTETKVRPNPQQNGKNLQGDEIFPAYDPKINAHTFETGNGFLQERVIPGTTILDIDGLMVINQGVLDLTKVTAFRGRGQILILKGDCKIGNLVKLHSTSNDTLKLYLHEGNFHVSDAKDKVKIEASLVSTASGIGAPQGLFYAHEKTVHILGNLIVDNLPIAFGLKNREGVGDELCIEHDPMVFSPPDPFRISIGQVRTMYCINAGVTKF